MVVYVASEEIPELVPVMLEPLMLSNETMPALNKKLLRVMN
jgi:hypothetical protein